MTTSTAARTSPGASRTRPRKASAGPSAGSRARTTPRNRPALHAVAAAERAVGHGGLRVDLPVVGRLRIPDPEEVAFLGGVAFLVMVGVMEWPVGLALGVGHALAMNRHNRVVRAFGEALERA